MKLYTIGDSWTYGDELVNPKEESWPSVLSKELDCELVNDAQCGGPNDWMFRRTIEWVCQQKSLDNTIVIVAWSEPNRREENFKPVMYGEKLWRKVMKYFYLSKKDVMDRRINVLIFFSVMDQCI